MNNDPKEEEKVFLWYPLPWSYTDGMIIDASGDSIIDIDEESNDVYFDEDLAKKIVEVMNKQ